MKGIETGCKEREREGERERRKGITRIEKKRRIVLVQE
jgi:hypothetical protein